MRYTTPHEKAPKWIKGNISVKVDDFIAFAQANQDARGWLNIDIKESKKGGFYLELNEWKRGTTKQEVPADREGYGEPEPYLGGDDDIKASDIPF